jgi:class 3 adenylate cyclase
MTSIVISLALLAIGLAGWLWQSRRETQRLRHRIAVGASELENLQQAFSRFAPDEVIERIIAEGVTDYGEKKNVTVLFADLAGFTALSEQLEPTVLVGILNGYFERMSQAITDHRGYVSTFIGDGLLAFFGATDPNPWQGNDCVYAALAMREALAVYNEELKRRGLPQLALGIGLHCGTGVVGLMGSTQLKEFAFVGRAVNVAARVQTLTRQFKVDIILTEALRKTIDPRFETSALPDTSVKGVRKALAIHTLDTQSSLT